MSETKPPDTPTGFIDLFFDQTEFADPVGMVTKERAMKQLAQLRAKVAAYDEAMRRLKNLADGWGEVKWAEARANIAEFVREQIAANRFAP